MPKADRFISATRSVMVPLTFEENDERKTEAFKVIYRAYSPRIARELEAMANEKRDDVATTLAALIGSIPEITNGDSQPLKMTKENLEQFAAENLMAIHQAIFADMRPTTAPPTSADLPPTSDTAPAAQV